jgi:hypothetical protein
MKNGWEIHTCTSSAAAAGRGEDGRGLIDGKVAAGDSEVD